MEYGDSLFLIYLTLGLLRIWRTDACDAQREALHSAGPPRVAVISEK
jgi:hypothetical protein